MKPILLACIALVLVGCGSDDEIDIDAGVARHLEVTGLTLADFDDVCDFDDPSVCGEDFLRMAIEGDCAESPDDATDRAAWEIATSAGVSTTDRLEVLAVACPDVAGDWASYLLARGD